MRVLHFNTHASGGSYEYAALLCATLAEQGIESRLLSKNSQPTVASRPLLDRVIRRSYISLSTEPWHGTRRLLSPPAPERLDQIDVVHLHTVADWFDVPHWLETLPRRMGVVISIHDMWHITGGCFLYRGCDRYATETGHCDSCPILRWPANRLLASAAYSRKLRAYQNSGARMVANSHWLAELAGRSAIAKACGGVRVIPPGIDTRVFKPYDKEACRKELGLPTDAFVIVTGGASLKDRNKNLPWLLEELSLLPELEKLIVLIFGEGSLPVPDRLKVRFAGAIRNRCDLAGLLAAADVFVSASLMETYGLTLVEAMACGIPVVAFRVGGIPEAAPEGQGAILCPQKDPTTLTKAITALRNSLHLRETSGRIAHETAHRQNDPTLFASKFAQLYRECVDVEQIGQVEKPAIVT
jgi:glycosyltransferase involved in cell wall biosynthesis